MRPVTSAGSDALLQEMQSVKKLLMLQLLAMGCKQRNLAALLGVSEATLSRMLPKGSTDGVTEI
jgi:DNA-binding transcriptional regulator LsrR (DeoR family)